MTAHRKSPRRIVAFVLAGFLSAPPPSLAQARQVPPPAEPSVGGSAPLVPPPTMPDAASVTIPDGVEMTVLCAETVSSKTAVEGDPVNFTVDEDLMVDGRVVVAKGTLVKGSVSHAEQRGRMGKAGKLSIRVETTTTVDGQKLKLRASRGREGEDKTGTTVALTVLFGPLGLLKRGKDVELKEGTRMKVFTDEEKTIVVEHGVSHPSPSPVPEA